VSFQAGEIRVCASCHGINTASQTGDPPPANTPHALEALLAEWKAGPGVGGGGGCTSGVTVTNARLRMRRKTPSLLVRGTLMLGAAPTPATDGVRVQVGTLLDATLPATGWRSKAKGRRWIFADRTGAHGGVVRVDLVSVASDAKRVTFKVAAAIDAAGIAPVALDAAIWLGPSAACATAAWNGPDCAAPRCTGRAGKVVCR
jgi:hypothetical protein